MSIHDKMYVKVEKYSIKFKTRYRGYSNVFVKYVFYFMSKVDNIYIS